ncbi:MAG: hypothetical protein CL963_03550 [Euryarchaeota archaeon]|mgnify:CR=1 FL=1|jgi:hypothetical protein|nr:hypothetical protein [Euryarchaeota archaeon]|tara:strand:+ start:13087 stop:13509 length:423 start_codon:yes stop_codon:yes gene_type:complete
MAKARKKSSKTRRTKKSSKKSLKIDFISMSKLKGDTIDEKIDVILEKVKLGHVVILDEALSPDEEAHLVTETMEGINEEFSGIEFCSLPRKGGKARVFFARTAKLFGIEISSPGVTLVGPSTIISDIKRDLGAFHVSAEL